MAVLSTAGQLYVPFYGTTERDDGTGCGTARAQRKQTVLEKSKQRKVRSATKTAANGCHSQLQ